jgi:betaine-aldehyde dehydrogenase
MRAQPKASHYVNGRYIDDERGASIPVIYPATGETIAELRSATPNIVELAIEAAREAQPAWARLKPIERGRILRRAADILRARNEELSRIETLDTGKAIQETLVADAASAADCLEYFAGAVAAFNGDYVDLGGPFAYTRREALGVCVGIGAWNYPIQIAGWKSAPALAMGNAMVFKPSENTPLSALALAEIYTEAGLPDGLFNVVQGYGDVGACTRQRIRSSTKISLTGSVPTGKQGVRRSPARMMKHCDDGARRQVADHRLRRRRSSKTPSAARCSAISTRPARSAPTAPASSSRMGLHDRFVERLVERTKSIRIGDPLDPETQMGPLVSKAQHDKVLDPTSASANSEGADTALWWWGALHCRASKAASSSSRPCSPVSEGRPCASPARRYSARS